VKLNPAQQEAVDYTDGPCLVLAGAGSGKTRVITSKISALIRLHSMPPEAVCAVTFTNKAAAEMRERAAADLGSEIASRITISTFHSLGLSIIRKEHATFGLGRNFSLFDEYDQQKIVRDIIREKFPHLLQDSSDRQLAETACQSISLWKSALIAPEDLKIQGNWTRMAYRMYDRYLRSCNAIDFEDLIYLTARRLRDDPDFRARWQAAFQYMLVDEYQDTNETQYQLLKLLTGAHRRFTVVGDDDQSIYSWRGARPENIKTLAEDYPDLKVIKLEQNYRSTARILHCANMIIAHNEHVFDKTLRSSMGEGRKIQIHEVQTEDDQSERLAELIFSHRYHSRAPWSDYAVLYRSNFQSRSIEKVFRENHIPCVITGGTSFFEHQEVKDLMGWCRVLCNPRDDAALLRVINVPRRGIGSETIAEVAQLARLNGKSMYDSMLSGELAKKINPRQMQALGQFVILVTNLRNQLFKKRDAQLAASLIDTLGYERHLKASTDSQVAGEIKVRNARTLMEWITDLINGKGGREKLTFLEAVDKLGLREMLNRNNSAQDADAVQMMTLHAAKGLEFPYVYMVGCEEGILPHRSSYEIPGGIAEERRLFYVGVTRARQELTLLLCRKRRIRAEDAMSDIKFNTPSRFLYEMPPEDIEWHQLGEHVSESKAYYQAGIESVWSQLDAMVHKDRGSSQEAPSPMSRIKWRPPFRDE
jgi:ATP-dependent DNA helicase Rep